MPDRWWRFLCWAAAGEVLLLAWNPEWHYWVPLALAWPILLGSLLRREDTHRNQRVGEPRPRRKGVEAHGKSRVKVDGTSFTGMDTAVETHDEAEADVTDSDIK